MYNLRCTVYNRMNDLSTSHECCDINCVSYLPVSSNFYISYVLQTTDLSVLLIKVVCSTLSRNFGAIHRTIYILSINAIPRFVPSAHLMRTVWNSSWTTLHLNLRLWSDSFLCRPNHSIGITRNLSFSSSPAFFTYNYSQCSFASVIRQSSYLYIVTTFSV